MSLSRFFLQLLLKFKMDASNNISNQQNEQTQKKNLGGRPLGFIWLHFRRIPTTSPGKFQAECNYCSAKWSRGETPVLKAHLANHCPNTPTPVLREYLEKVKNRDSNISKKRKLDVNIHGQTSITNYHNSSELPEGRIQRINRALVKFFVCCGISYRIVEHPFFIDFLKELNGGYSPPTREYLSGRLLENELSLVNEKVEADLNNQENLTLGMLL